MVVTFQVMNWVSVYRYIEFIMTWDCVYDLGGFILIYSFNKKGIMWNLNLASSGNKFQMKVKWMKKVIYINCRCKKHPDLKGIKTFFSSLRFIDVKSNVKTDIESVMHL